MKEFDFFKEEKNEEQNNINYNFDDSNTKNNYNNNIPLIQKPSVSYVSNENTYNNPNNYLKRYVLDDKNESLKLISKNINPKKEIVYNFGYKKHERLEPLKLYLIEDTIKEQEQEYQKQKKEKEDLQKKFEELYSKDLSKKNNNYFIRKKNTNSRSNNLMIDTNNNYEYLSKEVEHELNLTNRQMDLLDKEANIQYNQYKNFLKEKNKLLINNNQRYNKIFYKQGINIIKKNKFDINKNKLKTNKEIGVPIPLLLSCMFDENKRKNIKQKYSFEFFKHNNFSPLEKKGFHYFHKINGNIIKPKIINRSFSEMI